VSLVFINLKQITRLYEFLITYTLFFLFESCRYYKFKYICANIKKYTKWIQLFNVHFIKAQAKKNIKFLDFIKYNKIYVLIKDI